MQSTGSGSEGEGSGVTLTFDASGAAFVLDALGFPVAEDGTIEHGDTFKRCCVCGAELEWPSEVGGVFKSEDGNELCCKNILCLDERMT